MATVEKTVEAITAPLRRRHTEAEHLGVARRLAEELARHAAMVGGTSLDPAMQASRRERARPLTKVSQAFAHLVDALEDGAREAGVLNKVHQPRVLKKTAAP